jgi:hypothetical protein
MVFHPGGSTTRGVVPIPLREAVVLRDHVGAGTAFAHVAHPFVTAEVPALSTRKRFRTSSCSEDHREDGSCKLNLR